MPVRREIYLAVLVSCADEAAHFSRLCVLIRKYGCFFFREEAAAASYLCGDIREIVIEIGKGCKGVPGKAQYHLAVKHACHSGCTGLYRRAVEQYLCPHIFHHLGEKILLPHRNTACGDDDVGAGEPDADAFRDALLVIGAVVTIGDIEA